MQTTVFYELLRMLPQCHPFHDLAQVDFVIAAIGHTCCGRPSSESFPQFSSFNILFKKSKNVTPETTTRRRAPLDNENISIPR